ncbi:MAG: right-handed parallel beta-helix repeat-containing protein [Myxococcota bacterium]
MTISSSGAYRLTSNLRSSSLTSPTVQINVRDVDLDLNQFSVRCSVLNFPSFSPCADSPNTGAGGIDAAAGTTGVQVRNGVVREMASHGIWLRGRGNVKDVRALDNGGNGILIDRGDVTESTATGNGVNGISTSHGRVVGNTASENGSVGILISRGLAKGNVVSDNGTHGIAGSNLVESNFVYSNAQCGLILSTVSGFANNVLVGNNQSVCEGLNLGSNQCNTSLCP